jgi:putative nucleotidyltransferase with HDIG domain
LWVYYIAFGASGYVLILGYTSSGVVGLAAVLVPLLALRISQIQYIENTKVNVAQLRTKNSELKNLYQQVENYNEELLLSLANIIDLRDPYTMGHSAKVADYAGIIAREMGLPDNRIELLRKSSLLHDIGKIGIPDSILFKPSELTFKEKEIIKEHSERGATIVTLNQSLQKLAPIIRYHHERYDGLGYPDGLKGEDIPLEARILCLADVVQAMTSNRIYRKSLRLEQVKNEIEKKAGTQFDPKVTRIFLDLLGRDPSIFEMPQWDTSEVSKLEGLGKYINKETAFITAEN